MVEPPAAVVLGPVGRTIAPPGVATLRRGDEASSDVDPIVRLPELRQRLDLDRSVADDLQQSLMAPDIAFERSDVEVAHDDRGFFQVFRPPCHAADEVEL